MSSKWSTDRKITVGFGIAFALLSLLPLVVYRNKSKVIDSSQWLTHTYEVMAHLESTMQALADAESGQRGYIITGREAYLAPYDVAIFQTKNIIAKLVDLTTDNASQQRRLETLKQLMKQKFKELDQAVTRRRSEGFAAAAEIVLTDNGKRLMDDIRGTISAMRREEERLLAERSTQMHQGISDGASVFWGITTLNFLILGACLLLVNRYIAHRRQTEQKLNEAREAAESANIAKSAFLANMSHEIRTPMTAILGYSDMLVEPEQSPSDRHDCLQTIRRNARHLLELINDVLDLSKIEAGKMSVEQIQTDLPQLASDVVSMMRPRAIEKGLRFSLIFDGPTPRHVRTDPLRLKQILVNLLGNAIKFTENGSVELRVKCDREADNATVRFDVCDTGIGITDQQLARLFQPFSQADESTTRRFGGSGLGLTISLRLAKMLGGSITAESRPLKGSTFTATISAGPIAEADLLTDLNESMLSSGRNAEPVGPTVALTGRLLLAEDGYDNQRLISAHLRRAGAEVVVAENGRIAVELVATRTFDVILMDMQMPEMDGYAAATELRRRGVKLPIIALTAHAMADDRRKCINAGCTDYLTKPIDKKHLLATVRRYLLEANPTNATEAAPIQPAVAAPTPPAITVEVPPPAIVASTQPAGALSSIYADDDAMREIIAEFVTGLPQQVRQLEQLMSARRFDDLRRLAHQLKGSGGGYGFQIVTDVAGVTEKLLHDARPDLDAVNTNVRELIGILRNIEGYQRDREQMEVAA